MNSIFKYIAGFVLLAVPVFAGAAGDSLSVKTQLGYDMPEGYNRSSAVSTVKGEELSRSFTPNLINSLVGRLPGLTVTQGSDEAGVVDNTLRARGLGTFQGLKDPLIVIDGFVSQYTDEDGYLRSLFSQLMPEEIESITLLKDAAATAIYGMRGANGVLLIKTKRGRNQPLKVNFNAQVGFQQAIEMPKFLDSYGYATLYNEAYASANGGAQYYSAEALDAYKNGTDKYLYPNVDWYDETLRKMAELYKVGLSFQGGNEIAQYFVLLNYMGNSGLMKRTKDMSDNTHNQIYNRYNVRSNVDVNITKNLSAHVTLGIAIEDKKTPGGTDDMGKNTSDLFTRLETIPANSFPVRNPNGTWGGSSNWSNPLANIVDRGYWTQNSRYINSALRLTEKLDMLLPGLSVSGAISFNSYYLSYFNRYANYEYYSLLGKDAGGNYLYSEPYGKKETITIDDSMSDQWRNTTLEGSLNYDNSFGNHDLHALLLYSYESETYGNEQPYVHVGMGANFAYTYAKKYTAEFSMGVQATETFAKGHRTGVFPAGAVSWVISEEDFLKDNDVVKYLKLRTSYGLTGNDQINGDTRFMYEQEYGEKEGYNIGVANGYIPGYRQLRLANPDISWEKEQKFNIGIETDLWGKLGLSVDYFHNRRAGILCLPNRSIPSYIGAELPYQNIGKTKNQGVEASVMWNDRVGRDFNYYVKADVWASKNKILYMSEEIKAENNTHLYKTGHHIDQAYYLEALGYYTQAEIDDPNVAKPTWKEVVPGDLKYKDWNGDGVIDNNDSYPFGYTEIPEITLGLNLGFTYKNFDFSAFFHGVLNRTVYLDANYYKAFQNNGSVSEFALGRWTSEDTADKATYPRLSLTNEQNNYRSSTFWARNGNFLKLRDVEVGYTFKDIIPSTHADLRVFANGTNLFAIDDVEGYDSERIGGYPAVRTVSLGVNVQF